MLLMLQSSGRLTAEQLAIELEVSPRTILRDVDALSQAGVPIFTVQGAHGGIELLGGFRTELTGVTRAEAAALFLAGQPQIADRLGHGPGAAAVRRKLVEALPPDLRDLADGLDHWFLHDPDEWDGHQVPYGEIGRLAAAIEHGVEVELHMAGRPMEVVRPLALVVKVGRWFLVSDAEPDVAIRDISDLRGLRLTRRRFDRPADFDLRRVWRDHLRDQPVELGRRPTSATTN